MRGWKCLNWPLFFNKKLLFQNISLLSEKPGLNNACQRLVIFWRAVEKCLLKHFKIKIEKENKMEEKQIWDKVIPLLFYKK